MGFMNVLSRDQQIAVIAALCDGLGHRAVSRITGVNRGTVAALALKVGRGAAELHDRMMVGVRTNRLELDELWAFVQRKRRWHQQPGADGPVTGDQYTYIALAASSRAIVSYLTGKRSTENTDQFVQDIRQRVIGTPEISTDGYHPYKNAIRDAFGGRAAHGTITKTYSVTHLAVNEASRRYSPAAVIAVAHDVVSGVPAEISTSYVERSHLTLRMSCRRFGRLTNGFSKRLEPHLAAVSLHVAFYNLCRTHESLRMTPAMALGITDRVWSIGDLLDAAVATQPIDPVATAPDRRKRVPVIDGGRQ
jgi:IS1 family transposase